jgi:hypothetical protein
VLWARWVGRDGCGRETVGGGATDRRARWLGGGWGWDAHAARVSGRGVPATGGLGGPCVPSGPWGGEDGWVGWAQGEGRGLKLPLLSIFSYFFCYWVFRFWFINFKIQMSFENFE